MKVQIRGKGLSFNHLLNVIEYLCCERLFGQVLLIEKIAPEKAWYENYSRKSAEKKVWKKNAIEK